MVIKTIEQLYKWAVENDCEQYTFFIGTDNDWLSGIELEELRINHYDESIIIERDTDI